MQLYRGKYLIVSQMPFFNILTKLNDGLVKASSHRAGKWIDSPKCYHPFQQPLLN